MRKNFVENLSWKIFRGENAKNINLKIHIFRKIKSSLQQRFTPIAGLALAYFASVDIWLVFTNLVRKKFCIFVWSVFAAATGVSRDTLVAMLAQNREQQLKKYD